MPIGTERVEKNPESKVWVKKNNALYSPHVLSIADSLNENSICIVAGRYGIGKTHNLCPALRKELSERKWVTEIDDFGNHLSKAPLFRLIKPSRKVVILDEAGETLSLYEADALKMTKRLYNSGIKIVSVFGYHPEKADLLEQRIDMWKKLARIATGKEPTVYKLPENIITPEVASAFLKDTYKYISQEALDFILAKIPMNWRIINDLGSSSYSVEELKLYVKNHMDAWLRIGQLSEKEHEIIKGNLL